MADFQTTNPNLGKFWRALELKMLVYFMTIWNIITAIWYILWSFGNFVVICFFALDLVYCVKKNLATLIYAALAL
jgi:hypothetical protein